MNTNTPQMKQRKALIKQISLRHRAEDALLHRIMVQVENKLETDRYQQIIQEEYTALKTQSICLR